MVEHVCVAASVVLVDSVKVLDSYWYIVPVYVKHCELFELNT